MRWRGVRRGVSGTASTGADMSDDAKNYDGPTSVGGLATTLANMPTDGDWQFVPTDRFPFGFRIVAGDVEIMSQDAHCFSTGQKTRQDNDLAIGFPWAERQAIQRVIREQNANGRAMAASKDMLAAIAAMLRARSPADIDAAYVLMRVAYTKAVG